MVVPLSVGMGSVGGIAVSGDCGSVGGSVITCSAEGCSEGGGK